jgi:uncharacterized RDD family membrane protein YckC
VDYWEDYEVLTIETPEMLELRLPLAGFGPRALAWLLDSLIVGFGMMIVFVAAVIVLAATISGQGSPSESRIFTLVIVVMISVAVLCPLVYYVSFETLWNGQTPGKRWLGIRVIRRGGLPLTFNQVLLRNLLRIVDTLPSNGMTGLISFFATRYQQRVGDLAADTVVVREFTTRQPFGWAGTPDALAVHPSRPGALTPAIAYAAGSYLHRAQGFDQHTRLTITDELIRRLGYSAQTLSLREREEYLASVLYQRPGGG